MASEFSCHLDALLREVSTLEVSLSSFMPKLTTTSRPEHTFQSYKTKVSSQIAARDLVVIKRFYEQHATVSNGLSEIGLRKMLRDLNHHVGKLADEDIQNLFALHDLDHNGYLDFEECYRIIEIPSPMHHWFSRINLNELLTDCFEALRETKFELKEESGGDLEFLAELTAIEIEVVCNEFAQVLVHRLKKEIDNVRQAQKVELDRDSQYINNSSKFCVFPINCGGVDDFYAGLEGRLGTPHLNLFAAMELEHCILPCFDLKFETSNYKVTTTPSDEWDLVVNEKNWETVDKSFHRQLKRIDELMESDATVSAKLRREEVTAIVLYTGPVYMVYNAALRRWSPCNIENKNGEVLNLYQHLEAGNNLFAIQKLAKVEKVPENLKLYRGLGGTADLPKMYLNADTHGRKGFVEWGFMSTTSERKIALQYSGVREGKPLPYVFEFTVGAVNRGACIKLFSQYPAEIEYLFAPCAFLEPVSMPRQEFTDDGVVTIFPTRINVNFKAKTVDEIINQKKQMHLASFKYTLDEIKRDLKYEACRITSERLDKDVSTRYNNGIYSLEFLQDHLLAQCTEVFYVHKSIGPEKYTDDYIFQGMVMSMLELKNQACSAIRWYSVDDTVQLFSLCSSSLVQAHRGHAKYWHNRCVQLGLLEYELYDAEDVRGVLIMAASDGRNLEEMQALTYANADVNFRGLCGETPITVAVRALAVRNAPVQSDTDFAEYAHLEDAQLATIKALVALGGDANARDTEGQTAAHSAALLGAVRALETLHELDAGLFTPDFNGRTPLHLAAASGQADAVVFLCGIPAGQSKTDSADNCGWTPLMVASDGGHAAAVAALLGMKCDANAADITGKTALALAAKRGHGAAVAALGSEPEARADVRDTEGWTALHHAADNGHAACIELLHRVWPDRLDLDAKCSKGQTPLVRAAMRGQSEAVEALARLGANVAAPDEVGETPLGAVVRSGESNAATLRVLLRFGADANAPNALGRTPLQAAESRGLEWAVDAMARAS